MKKGNDDLNLILEQLEEIAQLLRGNMVSPWMTIKEAAAYLRCSPSKINQLSAKGLLVYQRLDPTAPRSPRLYHKRDLVAFLITGRNPQKRHLSAQERRIVEELL